MFCFKIIKVFVHAPPFEFLKNLLPNHMLSSNCGKVKDFETQPRTTQTREKQGSPNWHAMMRDHFRCRINEDNKDDWRSQKGLRLWKQTQTR